MTSVVTSSMYAQETASVAVGKPNSLGSRSAQDSRNGSGIRIANAANVNPGDVKEMGADVEVAPWGDSVEELESVLPPDVIGRTPVFVGAVDCVSVVGCADFDIAPGLASCLLCGYEASWRNGHTPRDAAAVAKRRNTQVADSNPSLGEGRLLSSSVVATRRAITSEHAARALIISIGPGLRVKMSTPVWLRRYHTRNNPMEISEGTR
jgi:hypothetical protein